MNKIQKILNDFKLWSHNFVYIIDNNGEKVHFDLNEAQEELNGLIDSTKFVAVAKARQSGISTYCLAKALYRAINNPNENILIASYKSDSSRALFDKLKQMNDWLPRDRYPELFPKVVHDNRDQLSFDNGSKIACVVAGTKDISRGQTISWAHLTELAFWQFPEKQLLGIEQALAKGYGKLTIETTSFGMNYWYKLFMSAYRGQSKYKSFFVPFYAKLYQRQFRSEYDLAEAWHKEYYHERLHAKDLEPEEKVIYDKCNNLRTIMWRRWKLLDMSLDDFHQEFPATPLESFVNSGRTIFSQVKVMEGLENARKPLPKNEVIQVVPDDLKKFVGKELLIYELPISNMRYAAGVDTSQGVGSDSSSVCMMSFDGMEVLNFNANKIPPYKFSELAVKIGLWYNYAMLVIENNGIGGATLTQAHKKYNYLNLYKQRGRFYKGNKSYHFGFDQSIGNSKAELIEQFREQFETDVIMINNRITFEEMQIFVEKDSGGMGNSGTGHDDNVISAALAVEGLKYATTHWFVNNIKV